VQQSFPYFVASLGGWCVTLALIATLSIALWVAVIGVVCLVRPAISYLVGI
jgi:hypothetical protein